MTYFEDDRRGFQPVISDDFSLTEIGEKRQYVVYGYRWVVLMVFVLCGMANAMVLLTWAPITDKVQTYWDDISITCYG